MFTLPTDQILIVAFVVLIVLLPLVLLARWIKGR